MDYQARLNSLQAILQDLGYSGLMVFPGPNLQYLTGHRGSFKLVPRHLDKVKETMIPPRDFLILVVPASAGPTVLCARETEAELITGAGWMGEVRTAAPGDGLGEFVIASLHELTGRGEILALEERGWWGIVEWFREEGLMLDLKNGSGLLYALRARKDEEEVGNLEKAAELADNALEEGLAKVAPGVSEAQVAATIHASLSLQGAKVHNLIVSSGATRSPEGTTTKLIENGELILIDINAAYNGYYCDMTRVFVCGNINSNQISIYEAVRKAWEAAFKAVVPNALCSEVDAAARKILRDNGLAQHFTHAVGHGIGLEDHECIWLYEQSPYRLEVGSVHTIEPAVYLPEFSIRLEDVVVVRQTGAYQLTKTSLDLREI